MEVTEYQRNHKFPLVSLMTAHPNHIGRSGVYEKSRPSDVFQSCLAQDALIIENINTQAIFQHLELQQLNTHKTHSAVQ